MINNGLFFIIPVGTWFEEICIELENNVIKESELENAVHNMANILPRTESESASIPSTNWQGLMRNVNVEPFFVLAIKKCSVWF